MIKEGKLIQLVDFFKEGVSSQDKLLIEHSERVAKLCEKFSRHLKLPEEQVQNIKLAGLFHDFGKLSFLKIINNGRKLTSEEYEEAKKHIDYGYNFMQTFSEFKEVAEIFRHHHEKYDGSGYPKGLAGTEIPFEARVLIVCDAFTAMTEGRSYQKKPFTAEEAKQELIRCKRSQFDPVLVDKFVEMEL
ncbi:MAG: HD domain-containing protein [Candidatus Woesearchaeota archaeon]|nr:MAG: HD domain-containing protein [Candidatus Woesearchaeota archaeon]